MEILLSLLVRDIIITFCVHQGPSIQAIFTCRLKTEFTSNVRLLIVPTQIHKLELYMLCKVYPNPDDHHHPSYIVSLFLFQQVLPYMSSPLDVPAAMTSHKANKFFLPSIKHPPTSHEAEAWFSTSSPSVSSSLTASTAPFNPLSWFFSSSMPADAKKNCATSLCSLK